MSCAPYAKCMQAMRLHGLPDYIHTTRAHSNYDIGGQEVTILSRNFAAELIHRVLQT